MGAINIKNISVDGAHAIFLLPGASEGARFQPRGYQIYLGSAHPQLMPTLEMQTYSVSQATQVLLRQEAAETI